MKSLVKKKIYLGVCGKFHAFSLAKEYEKMDVLGGLYAADKVLFSPKEIPSTKYNNRLDLALYQRLVRYINLLPFSERWMSESFDSWLLRELESVTPGVLHGWNGHVSRTFKQLKGRGWLLCVERSCPHNLFQHELLIEESQITGVDYHFNEKSLWLAIEELYKADVIVTPSQYSASSYQEQELKSKVRVAPLGGNFEYQGKQRINFENLKILTIGNSFLRKGIHYLIEAFKLIKDPKARLFIRGEVPRSYRAKITDSRIEIIPPVTRSQLHNLYREANVFCLPSVDEGFGMVTLEAIAFGLPIVITQNVGAADILNSDVCKVVPIRNPIALAEAIEATRNIDINKLKTECISILNKNTWRNCAKRIVEQVYNI